MTAKVIKEEAVFDPLCGFLADEEGVRSGGERSEPERRAPSRGLWDLTVAHIVVT